MQPIDPQADSQPDMDPLELERVKLNQETARIAWTELQRFFAQGTVIWVSADLDLVEMGQRFTRDDAQGVAAEMERGAIARVGDDQARAWLQADASLWALVVRPWILVQE
ncbi:DUF2288 domain-containing protein [Imhoffiella purpurea]|uniref:DUF2288 domain-containing protein n=1 Tax=Imhoffiella purpurea TaxID=1249627 RepID=W9VBW1_9GAMM|nr:DUF2288 domain-containing protein [Imhoffiella purpurea]EXJ17078.1 hypothetical protein D779_0830 [Imhoffiella purpurea]